MCCVHPCVPAPQVVIPVVSVQLIKKHKTARLLPNGLAITTTASRKVTPAPSRCPAPNWMWFESREQSDSHPWLGSERCSLCWLSARANITALLLFLNFTLFLDKAKPKRNLAEPDKSLPGSRKTCKLLKHKEGKGLGWRSARAGGKLAYGAVFPAFKSCWMLMAAVS